MLLPQHGIQTIVLFRCRLQSLNDLPCFWIHHYGWHPKGATLITTYFN